MSDSCHSAEGRQAFRSPSESTSQGQARCKSSTEEICSESIGEKNSYQTKINVIHLSL
jgi:hypothetical protein